MKSTVLLSHAILMIAWLVGARAVEAQTYQPSNRVPVADGTLGTQVTGTGDNFNVSGGVARGQNRFHSFQDFSVPTKGSVTFDPGGSQSIITRVTGSSFSDINGSINTQGANFLLINPNGVVFGPNTQLNVGRIFGVSTAASLDLVDGSGRSITFATNGAGDRPLLAVSPDVLFNPAQLNLAGGSGAIQNFGVLKTTNSGQYIGLIGGNVSMPGGSIVASDGGRVEVGGLAAPGAVGVSLENGQPRLVWPGDVARSNVSVTQGGRIDIVTANGGDLVINTHNLSLDKAMLRVLLSTNSQSATNSSADIKINATGSVDSSNRSFVSTGIQPEAIGRGGNIDLRSASLSLDNSTISSGTLGRGNSGDIKINTSGDIILTGGSLLFSVVFPEGIGRSGDISVKANSLSLRDSSHFDTASFGQGSGGDLKISTSGDTLLINKSSLSSFLHSEAIGQAGNIDIMSNSLSLNDSKIESFTKGQGNAGNVSLIAQKDISIRDNSMVLSRLYEGGIGNSGDISITAPSLIISGGSQVRAESRPALGTSLLTKGNSGNITVKVSGFLDISGFNEPITNRFNPSGISTVLGVGSEGKAGNISIDAGSLSLRDGSLIVSSTLARGDSGNITIKARDAVSVTNTVPGRSFVALGTAISSSVEAGGVGNGGNISITAGSLSLLNGGELGVFTRGPSSISGSPQPAGRGNAGNVLLMISGPVIIDTPIGNYASNITGTIFQGATGNGGNILVHGDSISIKNAGWISSGVFGIGNAGSIQLNALDRILVSGQVLVNNQNAQNNNNSAGNIGMAAPQVILDNTGLVSANSSSGNGGNIQIGGFSPSDPGLSLGNTAVVPHPVNLFMLRRGAKTSTDAQGADRQGSDGGNIRINAQLVVGVPNENSDITANANGGRGGNVTIASQGVFGIQPRSTLTPFSDITASSSFGQNGNISINTPDLDPGKDQGELPAAPTDTSRQIVQTCSSSQRDNRLVTPGKGGHPAQADDAAANDVVWQDPRTASTPPIAKTLVMEREKPAIGWQFDTNGNVRLLAATSQSETTRPSAACALGTP